MLVIKSQNCLRSPCKRWDTPDNIYTHYPVEEHLARGTGRFGDEAQRLSQIFARGTRHSLILLNESLASTNPGESLYIAYETFSTGVACAVRTSDRVPPASFRAHSARYRSCRPDGVCISCGLI